MAVMGCVSRVGRADPAPQASPGTRVGRRVDPARVPRVRGRSRRRHIDDIGSDPPLAARVDGSVAGQEVPDADGRPAAGEIARVPELPCALVGHAPAVAEPADRGVADRDRSCDHGHHDPEHDVPLAGSGIWSARLALRVTLEHSVTVCQVTDDPHAGGHHVQPAST